jgi:hypothetical protein
MPALINSYHLSQEKSSFKFTRRNLMKKSAVSVFVWGIYAVLSGLTFLLVPNLPLTLLGLGESQEVYPRVLGVAITMLGYFYLRASRQGSMTPFYAWSVHARLGLAGAIIVLVIMDLAKPAMLGFAVIELAGSLWTAFALRAEGSRLLSDLGQAA